METAKYRCATCEHEEKNCHCDRYCHICFGEDNIRLCQDGFFYCQTCRESCDYAAQN
jgi:hypothetical protein